MSQNISNFNIFQRTQESKIQNSKHQKRKLIVIDAGSKLSNEQMGELDNKYNKLPNAEENELHSRHNIKDLFLADYNYKDWFVPTLKAEEKKYCLCHNYKVMMKYKT